jgi:hypothetical protein
LSIITKHEKNEFIPDDFQDRVYYCTGIGCRFTPNDFRLRFFREDSSHKPPKKGEVYQTTVHHQCEIIIPFHVVDIVIEGLELVKRLRDTAQKEMRKQ